MLLSFSVAAAPRRYRSDTGRVYCGHRRYALIAMMTAASATTDAALAAVLVWRATTYFPPIFVGAGTYFVWRRGIGERPIPSPRRRRAVATPQVRQPDDRPGYTAPAKELPSAHPYIAFACTGPCCSHLSSLLDFRSMAGVSPAMKRPLFRWVNGWPEALYVPMTIFRFAGGARPRRPSVRPRADLQEVLAGHVVGSDHAGQLWTKTSSNPTPARAAQGLRPDTILHGDVPALHRVGFVRPHDHRLHDCHRADAIHLRDGSTLLSGRLPGCASSPGYTGRAPATRRSRRRHSAAR